VVHAPERVKMWRERDGWTPGLGGGEVRLFVEAAGLQIDGTRPIVCTGNSTHSRLAIA